MSPKRKICETWQQLEICDKFMNKEFMYKISFEALIARQVRCSICKKSRLNKMTRNLGAVSRVKFIQVISSL